mmetsp:Transcript_26752/g.74979  ORF Transcript_26752/g.74979 Transcript_26752/m.74979 type:complete len:215 (-) Transcript_26752:264-908(-)
MSRPSSSTSSNRSSRSASFSSKSSVTALNSSILFFFVLLRDLTWTARAEPPPCSSKLWQTDTSSARLSRHTDSASASDSSSSHRLAKFCTSVKLFSTCDRLGDFLVSSGADVVLMVPIRCLLSSDAFPFGPLSSIPLSRAGSCCEGAGMPSEYAPALASSAAPAVSSPPSCVDLLGFKYLWHCVAPSSFAQRTRLRPPISMEDGMPLSSSCFSR